MGSQEHPRFRGECVMRPRQALAPGHADEFVVETKVGGDRLLGWLDELRTVDPHGVDRGNQLRQIQLVGAFDQLACCPGLDRLSRDVDIEPIRQPLAGNEGAAVETVFDEALLHELAQGLADGAAAGTEQLNKLVLAQRGAGRDAAVDDPLPNDAANGLGGRQALESRQVPGLRGTVSVL